MKTVRIKDYYGIYQEIPVSDELYIGFSDLLFGNGLSKPFPNGKCAGIGEAARGAAPCSERSDAKQPGLSIVRAVCLAERTYRACPCIEVRPLFQRDFLWLYFTGALLFAYSSEVFSNGKVTLQFPSTEPEEVTKSPYNS